MPRPQSFRVPGEYERAKSGRFEPFNIHSFYKIRTSQFVKYQHINRKRLHPLNFRNAAFGNSPGGVDSGSPHEPSPLRGKQQSCLSNRAYRSLRERPIGAVARFLPTPQAACKQAVPSQRCLLGLGEADRDRSGGRIQGPLQRKC